MRAFAKIITGITLVVMLFVVYLLYGVHLQVEAQGARVVPASERAQEFEAIAAALKSGEFTGDVYQSGDLGEASEYSFVYIDMEVFNPGLLPAEMISVGLTPAEGDILMVPLGNMDLTGLHRTNLSVVVLCRNEAAQAERSVGLEYYCFGRSYTAAMGG